MTPEDIVIVMGPVASILDELNVLYYIGGSVAASAHGFPRSTNDVDAVAILSVEHVEPMIARLHEDYHIDGPAIKEAIRRRANFNLIHYETGNKVDVFLSRQRPYDAKAMSRRLYHSFEEEPFDISFWIASSEDALLSKLEWYRQTGESSDKQWGDIMGICKIQANSFDFSYLRQWAEELRVTDLLQRAFQDSGVEDQG